MTVKERIAEQFPSLFVTLVSILIGIFFDNLFAEARSRMVLWPLDIATLRTWGQIAGMGLSALTVWSIFAHIGISRRHVPTMADSIIVFLAPVPLLIGNAYVGQKEIWPWFYFASAYLVIATITTLWHTRLTLSERELAPFRRLYRPLGHLGVLYFGIPFYAAAGWAGQHAMLSPWAELLLAWSTGPAAILCTWLFFRDWHRAIAAADKAG